MIRSATLADIPAMVAMGKRFTDAAGFAEHGGYDPETVVATLGQLIEDENGICLVCNDGMAGAMAFPHPFNGAHKTCQELFWWSEGRSGLSLLNALERAAIALGAQSLVMATMDMLNAERMAKFYGARGFVPLDRNFIKVL